MTATPLRLLLLLVSLTLATGARAEDAVLTVDTVSGAVKVQREGRQLLLKVGDALQEQDQVLTEASGRLTLRFARHGFIDVGPDTEAGIERLPFAAYARDLKSIFSLSRGYLRVVWKHPQLSTSWPLFIYMSGHRISLTSGEFFFQHQGSEQLACVAAGQLALQAVGADGVENVRPPACTRLVAGLPPQTAPRSPDDWIGVRRQYSLLADSPQLARAAVPAPAAIRSPRDPLGIDGTGADPAVRASPAAAPGPVVPAPTLPAPTPAPRAGVVAATTLPAPVIAPATPAAPALPPVMAVNQRDWALNIASYADAAGAKKQADILRAAGYPAVVQPAQVNGKPWWRVQLTGYATQQEARAAAQALQAKLGLQGIWVVRPS